ncbi:MAG: hypothetical protein HYU39_04095 [Thaumarchaeota archaeon]|nr:hypothetical protein [Nitrososphaerota archaeon]
MNPPLLQVSPSVDYSTLVALALAVAVGVLVYGFGRRWVTIPQGFNYLDYLTGGSIPEGSVILLDGDAASGRSDIAQAMLHKSLGEKVKALAVLYDLHADEYVGRAERYGYSFSKAKESGDLRIVDCLSPLMRAPDNELLKDPYNITYVNIAVNDELDKLGNQRYLLILDSALPLLNHLNSSTVVDFIQTISLRVRRDRGIFLLCSSSQSIRPEIANRIASMVDGLIETKLRRSFGISRKTLTVKWIRERRVQAPTVRFDNMSGRGVVFRLSPR